MHVFSVVMDLKVLTSIEFEEPVRAITPGQAAVIYRDQQLVARVIV